MNHYLDADVAMDKTQDIQELALVLVNALDLHIEERLLTDLKQRKNSISCKV